MQRTAEITFVVGPGPARGVYNCTKFKKQKQNWFCGFVLGHPHPMAMAILHIPKAGNCHGTIAWEPVTAASDRMSGLEARVAVRRSLPSRERAPHRIIFAREP